MVRGVEKAVLDVESAMVKFRLYKIMLQPGFIEKIKQTFIFRISPSDPNW